MSLGEILQKAMLNGKQKVESSQTDKILHDANKKELLLLKDFLQEALSNANYNPELKIGISALLNAINELDLDFSNSLFMGIRMVIKESNLQGLNETETAFYQKLRTKLFIK